jgi:hypothetical protein
VVFTSGIIDVSSCCAVPVVSECGVGPVCLVPAGVWGGVGWVGWRTVGCLRNQTRSCSFLCVLLFGALGWGWVGCGCSGPGPLTGACDGCLGGGCGVVV